MWWKGNVLAKEEFITFPIRSGNYFLGSVDIVVSEGLFRGVVIKNFADFPQCPQNPAGGHNYGKESSG